MKAVSSIAFIIMITAILGCNAFNELQPSDTLAPEGGVPDFPGPGSWPQFHGNGPNHGSLFVASEFALEPKWTVDVGQVIFSSLVVGGNGTIYIGDEDGELLAIHPAGFIEWRANLTEPINSSPAISPTGLIYVVTTRVEEENSFRSTLHLLTPQGTLIRSTPLPDNGFTTSSPKIWRSGDKEFIFLYARRGFDTSSLLIFNRSAILVHQEKMGCLFPVTGSSSIWDWFGDVLSVLWDALYEGGPGISFDPSGPEFHMYEDFGWLDPTLAIIDNPALTAPDQPLVILVDKACFMKAYLWNPPGLTELWSQRHTANDAERLLFQSSPAVIKDSHRMVIGAIDGTVRGYDVLTGAELWETEFPQAVMGTPASLGGLVYVASESHLRALDSADGSIVYSLPLPGKTIASPLLSGSRVYISEDREFLSLSFDLKTRVHLGIGNNGGLASPAIGSDGTIYTISLMADTAFLKAYGGLEHRPVFPGSDQVAQ